MLHTTDIDVVVFDVLGTLVDEPTGLRSAVHKTMPDADAEQVRSLTERWQRFVADQQHEIAIGTRAYVDSEVLDAEAARNALDAAADMRIATASDAITHLATASRRLPPWPDSAAELDRIANRLPVLALSNAAPTTLLHLAARTGMRWHHAVTAHDVAAYKPSPSLYRRAVHVSGRPPERILMVAAHAWDLRAAQDAGMRTCYVDRPVGDPPTASDRFDLTVAGLNELLLDLG
ncbi:haloacid dehalogenase type II [Microbacterium shaanxiense]